MCVLETFEAKQAKGSSVSPFFVFPQPTKRHQMQPCVCVCWALHRQGCSPPSHTPPSPPPPATTSFTWATAVTAHPIITDAQPSGPCWLDFHSPDQMLWQALDDKLTLTVAASTWEEKKSFVCLRLLHRSMEVLSTEWHGICVAFSGTHRIHYPSLQRKGDCVHILEPSFGKWQPNG